MIPLESATAILPRMPTGRTIAGLTIIKPPVVDMKCRTSTSAISSPLYRLLRSRNQRRNSSASSVRSSCSAKTECKQFLSERVEIFELKDDTRQSMQVESVLRGHSLRLSDNCQEKSVPSRRSSLISSARECRVNIQEALDPSEVNKDTKQLQAQRISVIETTQNKNSPAMETKYNEDSLVIEAKENKNSPTTEIKLNEDSPVMEIKQNENSPAMETKYKEDSLVIEAKENKNSPTTEIKLNEDSPCELANTCKKNVKKSHKTKKTAKKRRNSVKKTAGVTGIFARFVGSHGRKKHQEGHLPNSKEPDEPGTNSHQSKDNSSKYLSIQKLHATYAPKKTENKSCNAIVLPRVSNTSLTKDNYSSRSTPSPRKQQQELENVSVISPLSSPRKLLNFDDDKVKKVYLSEAHSGMITGIPCAPPCTPTVDELKKVEYILSLTDVKSQRAVKTRLVTLGNKMRAEEQRKKEKAAKEEQKKAYGAILQLKQRQRAEIYALNKVMTELENENFRKFMEENSAETLPV